MNAFDYVLNSLGLVITLFIQLLYYSKLSNIKLDTGKFKTIIFLVIILIISYINIFYNESFSKLFINFCLIFITFYTVFSDNFKKCLIRSIICFIIQSISEILLSIVVIIFFENVIELDSSSLFKFVFSLLINISSYIILTRKFMKRFADFVINKLKSSIMIFLTLVFLLISLFLLIYKYSLLTFNYRLYVINVGLIICFIMLFCIILYNNYKTNLIRHEHEVILKFMRNYEKLVDENRIKLHEVHNDLLVLKGFSSSKKKYNQLLDELIDKYSNNGISYKNIHNLPSGLKGILYYKMYEMKNNNVNVNLYLPNKTMSSLEKFLNNNLNIMKIFNILLDNAKDAASESENKEVFIEFVDKKDVILIIIENTYLYKPDLNKIYNKGYSSKGKFRGYGLYILKKYIDEIDEVELNQYIDGNKFISEVKIRK